MTPAEFAKGWSLLILQPWGWRYRAMDKNGQPSQESMDQLNFYFDKLRYADGRAWMDVAELYAQGSEWPSLSALRQSLYHTNQKYVVALAKPEPNVSAMPDEVREQLQRLGVKIP